MRPITATYMAIQKSDNANQIGRRSMKFSSSALPKAWLIIAYITKITREMKNQKLVLRSSSHRPRALRSDMPLRRRNVLKQNGHRVRNRLRRGIFFRQWGQRLAENISLRWDW